MPKCVFDKATGVFVSGANFGDVDFDSASQISLRLPEYPDPRMERWDGAKGLRPATAQDLADQDDSESDAVARREIDNTKALKAVVLWMAGKLNVTPAQARTEILAIYKSL